MTIGGMGGPIHRSYLASLFPVKVAPSDREYNDHISSWIQHVRDSGCLTPELVAVYGRSDGLPAIESLRYIVVCEGLRNDKKERYLFGPKEQQRSDGATFSGNRLARYGGLWLISPVMAGLTITLPEGVRGTLAH